MSARSCFTPGDVGDTSIAVRIETRARERGSKHAETVTEDLFTYAAIDEMGRPRKFSPEEADDAH